jgi:CTP:molybdopterin cytidylyltransferase MocA
MNAVRIAAIVLGAGEGRRIGGPKALLPIGGTTFLDYACRRFAEAGLSVIAVLGAESERVRRETRLPVGVCVVVNEAWHDGMLSSVWRGLDEAEAQGAGAVLLHPVDHPLVEPSTVARVAAALASGAAIAVPTWQGRRGHPGGFARTVYQEIRSASPNRGARAVLDTDPARIVSVVGDPGCLAGVDTQQEYERLLG